MAIGHECRHSQAIIKHVDPLQSELMTMKAKSTAATSSDGFRISAWRTGRANTCAVAFTRTRLKASGRCSSAGIVGTFHHIGTEHLDKYADEFCVPVFVRHVSDGTRAEQISRTAKASG